MQPRGTIVPSPPVLPADESSGNIKTANTGLTRRESKGNPNSERASECMK